MSGEPEGVTTRRIGEANIMFIDDHTVVEAMDAPGVYPPLPIYCAHYLNMELVELITAYKRSTERRENWEWYIENVMLPAMNELYGTKVTINFTGAGGFGYAHRGIREGTGVIYMQSHSLLTFLHEFGHVALRFEEALTVAFSVTNFMMGYGERHIERKMYNERHLLRMIPREQRTV